MTSHSNAPSGANPYTHGPLGPLYAKTALPIIFVMGMNGLLTVADALFLGHYVGPAALSAVTMVFPFYMLLAALATLVASGMSSILARRLGAEDTYGAEAVFAGAHGLALGLGLSLIGLYLAFGTALALWAADGDAELAAMGQGYLGVLILAAPLSFVLSVNSDALRNEGRVGMMAGMSLLVSLANIGFNYILIALAGLGVAGSALGTVLAQGVALVLLLGFRLRGRTALRPAALWRHRLSCDWTRILALGAPQSLNFLGLALNSTAIIAALHWTAPEDYAATVAGYGVITRVMTFCFLPLLGLSQAMQTITGSNFGARLWPRTGASLRIALFAALAYGAAMQALLSINAQTIGAAFVADAAVISEVARILPVMVALFFATGPLMMIATFFQAIGNARLAALLGLSKPYLFALPLTFALAWGFGEPGIWRAGPLAEGMLLCLTVLVLTRRAGRLRWGLFPMGDKAA